MLAAALTAAGWQTWRLSQERRAHATTLIEYSHQVAVLEQAARDTSEKYRRQEKQWQDAINEVANDADQQIALAQRDAADARTTGQRLREQYGRAVTALVDRAAQAPGAAGAGPAASETGRVLTDVQRRLDEAADAIAGFADQSFNAATACWAASGALE